MEEKTRETLKKLNREKLFIIRRLSDKSQRQVAVYLGVGSDQYSRWELGKYSPNILLLKAIVTDYFHLSMDDYLNENISGFEMVESQQNNGSAPTQPSEKRNPCDYSEKARNMIKDRLPVLRQMNNVSEKAMAVQLNIRLNMYNSWERGISTPDAIMLKKIVTDILHYSVDDFLNESLPVEELRPIQNNVKAREKALKILTRDKLAKLRENAGISQDEMAEFLEVDRTLYESWEQGNRLIDTLTLRKIVVEIFHLSLEDFLDESISSETLSSKIGNGLQPFLLNSDERNIIKQFR